MKKTILATLATLSAGAAFAGSITYVAPSNDVMIEPSASMGGSGSWLIPLVIVAVLALALTQNNDEETPQ